MTQVIQQDFKGWGGDNIPLKLLIIYGHEEQ